MMKNFINYVLNKKFLMDENNLLTFGIMGTKVKKEYIKEIANKYLYGF